MKKTNIILLSCFCILFITASPYASAYSIDSKDISYGIFGDLNWKPDALNSQSQVIGNYEVVVTTDPVSPAINKITHIQFKVYNYNQGSSYDKLNYAEIAVNHFTMGVRIYHNDELVHEISPQYHDGSSWSTDYVFTESGNHVLKIDLYGFDKDNKVVTYLFNIPVTTEFGPIFQYLLVAAAAAFAIILIWIKITMKKNTRKA